MYFLLALDISCVDNLAGTHIFPENKMGSGNKVEVTEDPAGGGSK